MHLILPPSETKVAGGQPQALDLARLAFPALAAERAALVNALERLAIDEAASIKALKLGATQHALVAQNRDISGSPTLAAIDRFTGVLFDGLDAASLSEQGREFAGAHLLIHSALLGPIGALDRVPSYRLSHDSRVPGISLKRYWARAVTAELATLEGLVLDLRSEGYAALGPLPQRADSVFVRVFAEGEHGVRRALNHFNKLAKGQFARAVLESGESFASLDELIEWAAMVGWRLERSAERPGELDLIV